MASHAARNQFQGHYIMSCHCFKVCL